MFRKSECIAKHKKDRMVREGKDPIYFKQEPTKPEDIKNYEENEEKLHYVDKEEVRYIESIIAESRKSLNISHQLSDFPEQFDLVDRNYDDDTMKQLINQKVEKIPEFKRGDMELGQFTKKTIKTNFVEFLQSELYFERQKTKEYCLEEGKKYIDRLFACLVEQIVIACDAGFRSTALLHENERAIAEEKDELYHHFYVQDFQQMVDYYEGGGAVEIDLDTKKMEMKCLKQYKDAVSRANRELEVTAEYMDIPDIDITRKAQYE